MLSVSSKHALNSVINSSKLFNKEDCFSNKGANHAKVVPLSKVPTSPTRHTSVGYREECIWINRHTWLRNPLNYDHAPSNFMGSPILGSLKIPWVLNPCCCNDTIVASSCSTHNANSLWCCCVCCFSTVIWWRSHNKTLIFLFHCYKLFFQALKLLEDGLIFLCANSCHLVLDEGRIRRLILKEGRIRRWAILFKLLGIVLEVERISTRDVEKREKTVWGSRERYLRVRIIKVLKRDEVSSFSN